MLHGGKIIMSAFDNKAFKPLPTDKFGKKFDKKGNKFFQITAAKPIQDPSTKRTHWIQVKLQLIIQPDGKVFGRETI